MQILVDADACPRVAKEILFRAAQRTNVPVVLVANQHMHIPDSELFSLVQVGEGLDVADERIVELTEEGDLVVTADIPLANLVVEKGGTALNPRGELYTANNVRQRLNMRDFMADLRGSGIETGGPPAYSQRNSQEFANALDRFLTKARRHKA
jgi:uncharacterized protein YaiI (UPF0178 family)